MTGQIIGPIGVLPTAVAWTPSSLGSALIGWYKADTQTYNSGTTQATNGQTISQWTDQSGNANHLTPHGANSPVYSSAGLGGKPSVTWTAASNQSLSTGTSSVTFGTGNSASAFLLGSLTNSGTSLGIGIGGNGVAANLTGTDANSATMMFATTGPLFKAQHSFGDFATQNVSASTESRMGMILDGVNSTPYLNNSAGTPVALSFSFTSPGLIVVGGPGAGGWDGEMCEIIITNTALSSGDRISLDAYLVSRQ